MNCIILKSKWHRWQRHHLEEIPKSRANSTEAMKNAKRITFKFYFSMWPKVGRGVCLTSILKPLVTSCWSSVVDNLSRRLSTSEHNLPWPVAMKPGCNDICCTSRLDVVLAFAASVAGLKEWDVEPRAKLRQHYLRQTEHHPAIPSLTDLWHEQ